MPKIKVEYSVNTQVKAEKLWDTLIDIKSWPQWQWSSYIEPVPTNQVKDGTSFAAELGGLRWNIRVMKAERPKSISWQARRMGLHALHEWEFKEEGGNTRALTRESMSGWMLFLLYPIAKKNLRKTDEKWLTDLKFRAEKV
jgi:hypothetical protein